MKHILIQHFSKFINLTADEIDALIQTMHIIHYKKGDILVREGQFHQETYFVIKGCIRQFQLLDGNEISTNFFTEEQWIISLESKEMNAPSPYQLVCVEDTSVVVGNEAKAQQLFTLFPRLEIISRKVIETAFFEQQQQMSSYITDKPHQRYLKLLQTRPNIFQRVPQYDIATYIGVKPESLSRIRRKLIKKPMIKPTAIS